MQNFAANRCTLAGHVIYGLGKGRLPIFGQTGFALK